MIIKIIFLTLIFVSSSFSSIVCSDDEYEYAPPVSVGVSGEPCYHGLEYFQDMLPTFNITSIQCVYFGLNTKLFTDGVPECLPNPICQDGEVLDSSVVPPVCIVPDVECPSHSSYSVSSEECVCNPPYLKELVNPPSLTNENDFICKLPSCPPYYEDHTPPLPLFKQTDNIANCNFFPYSDGATLEYEGIVCCYGQEGLDNNETCGNNELEVNGECYPITSSDSPEDDNRSCPTGEYYSLIEGHCVPFYDNNDTINNDNDGTGSTDDTSTDSTGDTSTDSTGDTSTGDNVYNEDDSLGSVNDALKFDRIQSVVEGAFDSYVLLPLPVTVSGTCFSEFRQTFDIFGHTYVLDINDYMSSLYDLLPILKAIILFISVYSAIVLVLAGKGD